MQKSGKIIALIFSIIILITILGAFFINKKISNDLCKNEIISEFLVRNGEYKIVIFNRNCGATTNISSQVSIVPNDKKISSADSGNILRLLKGNELQVIKIDDNNVAINGVNESDIVHFSKEKEGVNFTLD